MSDRYNSNFNNTWTTEPVSVYLNFTNNQTGKKVFEWLLSVAGKRERIPVEVKAFNNGTDVWFEASADCLPAKVRHSDINLLKDEVLAQITEQVNLLSNVEWEDWFEVIVTGANSDFNDSRHSALGADLKIQVNKLKRGIDPVTGRVLTIIQGSVTDFPKPQSIESEDKSISGYRIGSRAERSYVPATAENRIAIDSILDRMEELRLSIAGLLSQEKVESSLETGVLKALPRP